ncbi:hypothetical protein NDU88_008044 [Pleurodeles waltl]|uniref:Uncharacterized protein n=1 Tax=Pleurodeles waltl TaxID=8319 RepID=A0AAV7RWV2_PLEWA|nr:hypothetical protein NDU88_008044 [Pleurodeles waltl]
MRAERKKQPGISSLKTRGPVPKGTSRDLEVRKFKGNSLRELDHTAIRVNMASPQSKATKYSAKYSVKSKHLYIVQCKRQPVQCKRRRQTRK